MSAESHQAESVLRRGVVTVSREVGGRTISVQTPYLRTEALRLAKETGDVEGAVCRALCDGHVDEGERQEIVQQCREAVTQIQQVIRAAQSQSTKPQRLHS